MMRAAGSPQLRVSGLVSFVLVLSLAAFPLRSAQAQPAPLPATTTTPPPSSVPPSVASSEDLDYAQAESESALPWALGHRRYSTWYGPTGGIFLFDGRAAKAGAVRIQLGFDGFAGSDYLNKDDHVELTDQQLSLNIAALDGLEFYGTVSNRSVNQTHGRQSTLDVLGDFSIGGRYGIPLGSLLDLGFDLRGAFTDKIGGGGLEGGATTLSLRAALSLDLQKLPNPAPFIARLNVGYVLDNTAVVVEDYEDAEYGALDSPQPKKDETRHLVSRLQRFGMNINRLDRVVVGAGVEIPLRVARDFYLHPALEWQVGIPVNRQGYDCPNRVDVMDVGTVDSPEDSCYERMTSALPMNLAVGLRVVPPARGLSALLAFDFGLMGTDRFVRELSPNLPWRFLVAVSYDYDARPEPTAIPVVAAAIAPPIATPLIAPRGRVLGQVVSAAQLTPVAEAQVHFVDLQLSTLLTDERGEFATEPLPAGPVVLEIRHPDFDPLRCSGIVPPQGGDVRVQCPLSVTPIVGKVEGRVVDSVGPLLSPARVIVSGPANLLVMSDTSGRFVLDGLQPGTYQVRVESGAYFIRQTSVTIQGRAPVPLDVHVTRKPIAPSIRFVGDSIEAPAIVYATETSLQLAPAAQGSLAEIADLLLSRPDLYLQLQGFGPTDDIAKARAIAVKQILVDAGVPETHIEAVGGGTRAFRFLLHH